MLAVSYSCRVLAGKCRVIKLPYWGCKNRAFVKKKIENDRFWWYHYTVRVYVSKLYIAGIFVILRCKDGYKL